MKSILSFFMALVLILPLTSTSVKDDNGEALTGFKQARYAYTNKDEILNTKYVGTPSDETWSPDDEYDIDDTAVIYKEKGKDLTILNLTDIHLSDYDRRAFFGIYTLITAKRMIKRVKPDLITVTGDNVCGDSTVYSIKRLTSFLDSFKIPWAPIFGNHDEEANCDKNYLAEVMQKSEYCLLKKGPSDMGVGNYIVNIAEKDGDKINVVHSLIMMDTHKSALWDNQIEWYKWAAKGISEKMGHNVESSVLFHIPCAEYQYAYDEAWDASKHRWKDGYEAFGALHEKICCARDENGDPVNNGFFDAVNEVGTTKNIICGHDHMNNFSIVYKGVRLSYTLKDGTNSGFFYGYNGGTEIIVSDSGLTLRHRYCI
ncbi:MAG: metallophosphoesterase [Clostridiales bacterium]|nr:metallophosphoesterase [Clostridiales bacterium]